MKKILLFLLLPFICHAQNPLTVFHGGTGRSTLTVNSLLYGNGTSPVSLLAIGTNGQVLGVSGGVLTWTTPAPAITDYVATDPAIAHRNRVQATAGSIVALELEAKTGFSDIFQIQNNSGTVLSDFDFAGNLQMIGTDVIFSGFGTLNLSSATIPISLNGSSGASGFLLASAGSGNTPTWVDPSTIITDDVILNPLTDTRNKIEPAGDVVALGLSALNLTTKNLLEVYDATTALTATIDKAGSIATSKFIGAGTLTPAFSLDVKEVTQGVTHFHEENGINVEHKLNFVSTNTNAATVIQSWAIATGTVRAVMAHIKARQSSAGGAGVGSGFYYEGSACVQNVAGVLTFCGVGQNQFQLNGIGGGAFAQFVINGASLELKVTGTASAIDWECKTFIMM